MTTTAPCRDAVVASGPNIAIALSGGGNRAAIFGLGVLLYLVDTRLNSRVDFISSVSGGSITNGFIAQACDFRQVDAETFDTIASDLLKLIVRHGLFHGSALVAAYFMALIGGAILVTSMYTYGSPFAIPGGLAVALLFVLGTMALLRGQIISIELSRRFFAPSGTATKLSDLARSVEHAFCATDLNSSAPFYFSTWEGGYVHSPALGYARLKGSRLETITLGTAVRASAAFPGGIPPKRLKLGDVYYDFRLTHREARWQVEHTDYRKAGDYRPKFLFLADGGVWNNLATQALLEHGVYHGMTHWDLGMTDRPPALRQIVVNASAPLRAARLWRLHVPFLGEVAALTRSLNILNVNTVVPRITELRQAGNSVVVSITDPWDRALENVSVAQLVAAHPEDAELASWAKFNLEANTWSEFRLYETVLHEGLADACSAVPTTLGRISRNQALWLLIHGYLNAQAELYVKFGYPRPRPRPFQDRFARLIAPTRSALAGHQVMERIFARLDAWAAKRAERRRQKWRDQNW